MYWWRGLDKTFPSLLVVWTRGWVISSKFLLFFFCTLLSRRPYKYNYRGLNPFFYSQKTVWKEKLTLVYHVLKKKFLACTPCKSINRLGVKAGSHLWRRFYQTRLYLKYMSKRNPHDTRFTYKNKLFKIISLQRSETYQKTYQKHVKLYQY